MARRRDENLVIQQRLGVIQLAHLLGNVSEACRRMGVNRARFYEYQRRLEQFGLAGLKDRPPVHKSHPLTTPAEWVDTILKTSLNHPKWGCSRIRRHLSERGRTLSCPTIQKILIRHGRGKRVDRIPVQEKSSQPESVADRLKQGTDGNLPA
jgi:hypothetical protein